MTARDKTRVFLAASPVEGEAPPAFGQDAASAPGKREIPKDYDFNPKALKPLSRMLLSMSIGLGHTLTAHREFARIKSSSISPDGMIGGRGYVLKVQDIRNRLHQASDLISGVIDSIHDEINAPHWKSKVGELGENDAEDISEFLEESKKVMDDPSGYADEALDEVEEANDGPDGTSNETKTEGDPRFNSGADAGSKLPDGGDVKFNEQPVKSPPKTASLESRVAKRFIEANSSLPVTTLPGPRVQHLDPGDVDQTGPEGSYNNLDPIDPKQPGLSTGLRETHDYPSEWENDFREAASYFGTSAIPDAATDSTPTEANDFGLGYGAHGQATEGQDLGGTTSQLPGGGGVRDYENPGPLQMNVENHRGSGSELPNDGEAPVARSDYYRGDKGNQFNSESQLPTGPQNGLTETGLYGPNVGFRWQDQSVENVKYDYTTHTQRRDPSDLREDQRDFFSYDRNNDG